MNKNASGKNQLSRGGTNIRNSSTPQESSFVVSLKIPEKFSFQKKPNDSGGGEPENSETGPHTVNNKLEKGGSKDSIDGIKEFISATGERFYL